MTVGQRAHGDCGVAALASLAELSYEDCYVEVAKVDPRWRGKQGLYNREVVVVAGRLGLTLEPTRRFDVDKDDGVLRVRPNDRRSPIDVDGHFVALTDGRVRCPKFELWMPVRDYLAQMRARPCTLLRVTR